MTAPTDQQQQQRSDVMTDAAIVAAIAAILAMVVPSLPRLIRVLTVRPARAGEVRVTSAAAAAAGRMVLAWSERDTAPIGELGRRTQAENAMRRAQYLLAAARRMTQQLGVDTTPEAVAQAISNEQRYWRQHVAATANRERAATAADNAVQEHGVRVHIGPDRADGTARMGTVLGWLTVLDGRTDAECVHADRKNWIVEQPPEIGLPGAVHPHCRCKPVRPWSTTALVGGGRLPYPPT